MGNQTITIQRESKLVGMGITYSVEIDGLTVGDLDDGGTITAPISVGTHTVTFMRWRSVVKAVRVEVPEGCPGVSLSAKVNMSGRLDVSCSDYISAPAQPPDSEQPHAAASKGLTAPEKKSRIRLAIIALAVVVVFTAAFCVISHQQKTPTADSEQSLTADDLALALQNQAKSKFASGDYKAGLDLCFEVVTKYPGTVVASNIQGFAQTQVSKYTHVSAADLVAEYDANRVNADMKYDGEVVVVSGEVLAIDKTNRGKNLSVLLFGDSLTRVVQLNFELSQESSVASLLRGDSITAIGKCTGLSGTMLLVFESENVMVSNCLIIGKPE